MQNGNTEKKMYGLSTVIDKLNTELLKFESIKTLNISISLKF